MMIHNVFFWLKEGLTSEEVEIFSKGIHSLLKIETVVYGKVATPSQTRRPSIDHTYSFHLLTVFDGLDGHDTYQIHPIHKKFLEDCSTLWSKVIVYDSDEV